jgi:hypothetical protein
MFGVATALLHDSSSALSFPVERQNAASGEADSSSPAALPQQPPLPAPARRRSGEKSASYDEARAHHHPPSGAGSNSSRAASDLASAQELLAEFFAAAGPFGDADDPSVATYPRRDRRSAPPGRSAGGERQPFSTGRYLNEAAFVQQLEQRQRADGLRRRDAGAPAPAPADRPAAPPSSRPAAAARPVALPATPLPVRSRHLRHHHSSSSVKSDASPAAASAPAAFGGALKLFPPSFFPGDRPCEACKGLEDRLEAALDDVEYLRAAALQHEVALPPSTAPADTSANPASQPPWTLPAAGGTKLGSSARVSLSEASKQVAEATARHRKQVEQLMKERVRCLL